MGFESNGCWWLEIRWGLNRMAVDNRFALEGISDSNSLIWIHPQVGKTSFIKYVLEREFPGSHIGPEPTTDRFWAIMHGATERITPGNALAVQADKPFRGLSQFGTGFLSKFECSQCPSPILESITFIDTPGINRLSGIARYEPFLPYCQVWTIPPVLPGMSRLSPVSLSPAPHANHRCIIGREAAHWTVVWFCAMYTMVCGEVGFDSVALRRTQTRH